MRAAFASFRLFKICSIFMSRGRAGNKSRKRRSRSTESCWSRSNATGRPTDCNTACSLTGLLLSSTWIDKSDGRYYYYNNVLSNRIKGLIGVFSCSIVEAPSLESETAFGGDGKLQTEAVRGAIREQFYDLYLNGYTNFATGLSRYIGMLCAESILNLQLMLKDIRLFCVLPDESYQKTWSFPELIQHQRVLDACTRVSYMSDMVKGDTDFREVQKQQLIHRADALFVPHTGHSINVFRDVSLRRAREYGKFMIFLSVDTLRVVFFNKPREYQKRGDMKRLQTIPFEPGV